MPVEEIRERWVVPVYLQLLHGNFCGLLLAEQLSPEREQMISVFRRCLVEIEPPVVAALIRQPEWRARLSGAWYAGLRGWRQFRDELGVLLVESQLCYAGQGYCAALACFADEASAAHLRRYLDTWLPRLDKFYDQHWALPALVWLDAGLNTNYAAEYLAPDGPWDRWAGSLHRDGLQYYRDRQRRFDLNLSAAIAGFRTL